MFTLKRLAAIFTVALLATFAPYSLEVAETARAQPAATLLSINDACAGSCVYEKYSTCLGAGGEYAYNSTGVANFREEDCAGSCDGGGDDALQ